MTPFTEKAREIADKYYSYSLFKPSLIKSIEQALSQVREKAIRECAEVAESFKQYADQSYYDEVAQAILSLLKKEKK